MTMKLLVMAPHPDDEILGCTGLMLKARQEGAAVQVVIVTDGALAGDAPTRQAESRLGLARLGLPAPLFWGYPDGALPVDTTVQARYLVLVETFQPTHLALPVPTESHPDHRRLTWGVLAALTGRWSGNLVFYETTTPMAQCNRWEPVPLEDKLAAMREHSSQVAQFDYVQLITAISSLRGISLGRPAAEGYLCFFWDGSEQDFFEHRPLVSVLVRADDAALLKIALHSIEQQEYDHLEALVLWHGGETLPSLPAHIRGAVLRGPGRRSANLNLGLESARGAYVAILDQDDAWKPSHLSTLVSELQSAPQIDLAYGDYERVRCRRTGDVVEQIQRELVRTEPFLPGRLMVGNHIPINTYVCRASLAQRLRFDEALDAYEDWDFLLRAELDGARLRHVAALVSEYRMYEPDASLKETDTHVAMWNLHQQKGYSPWLQVVRTKLHARMTATDLNTVLDLAEQYRNHAEQGQRAQAITLSDLQAARAELTTAKQTQNKLESWADELAPLPARGDPVSRLAAQSMGTDTLVSILMPVCDPNALHLKQAIESVVGQTYPHWQLCVTDDASRQPYVSIMLREFSESDDRICVQTHANRQGIVGATLSASRMATGKWLAFVDHDDILHPDALLEVINGQRRNPEVHALYTDSTTVDRNGVKIHTFLKPGWSPETLLHLNYVNHLSVIRRDVYDAVGGLRAGMEGSQDWDLWLRLSHLPDFKVQHIAKPLYDWRATEASVAYSVHAKPYVMDAAKRATLDHVNAKGLTAVNASFDHSSGNGIRLDWKGLLQPLTAIVLTHRNPRDLAKLMGALKQSTYPDLQVIVVGNRVSPDDVATRAWMDEVATWPGGRAWDDDRAFNWSALNNAAAARVATPWMVFLNDDVCWSAPDTLEKLARYLTLDEHIGAVGMRLMYPPDEGGGIQHDGIRTSTDGAAVAQNIQSVTHDAGMNMPRNVSAVTGACLLTTREAFTRCSGFDESLPLSFNDVDYCLRLRAQGYRIVQASDVEGIHHESRTRGLPTTPVQHEEIRHAGQRLITRWGDALKETHTMTYDRAFLTNFIVRIGG